MGVPPFRLVGYYSWLGDVPGKRYDVPGKRYLMGEFPPIMGGGYPLPSSWILIVVRRCTREKV